eukprot:522518_1
MSQSDTFLKVITPSDEYLVAVNNSDGKPVSVREYEEYAAKTLPKNIFTYYASGSKDVVTLRDNFAAYNRLRIRPRVLRNISNASLRTTILGKEVGSPICIAPTALQRMAHDEGEKANAAAAAKTNTLMCLSSWSTVSLEDVAEAVPGGYRWFQLYVAKNRKSTVDLVKRAEAAGYSALAVTVDTPVLGDYMSGIYKTLPPHLAPGNIPGMLKLDSAKVKSGFLAEYMATHWALDSTLNWDDLKWLRKITKLSIVVKGIMTAEDAELAIENGADAIWVSNHGGRRLDTCAATIEMLPEVVKAVRGRCEVYVDGGIRRGTDAFKALAIGARAVFVGRPILWGLAHSGMDGVLHLLKLLNDELKETLQLSGCSKLSDIRRTMVCHQSQYARL